MALDSIIISLLGLWFAFTLLYATPLGTRLAVNGMLITRFIPRWNFFAPVPGTHDFHLLYRDQLVDGCVGPWRECVDFVCTRRIYAPIWHPEKRAKKTIYDITVAFMPSQNDLDPHLLQLSIPHLLLLNYVVALPRSSLSVARQFVVIGTCASDPKPDVLVLSGMHSL